MTARMTTDWKSAYAAALRERDPKRVPDLCDEARHAINTRLLEFATRVSHTAEIKELEEALRQLVIYELTYERAR